MKSKGILYVLYGRNQQRRYSQAEQVASSVTHFVIEEVNFVLRNELTLRFRECYYMAVDDMERDTLF